MKKPIDELAKKKETKELKDHFRLLHTMYDGGRKDPDMWYKALIYMAFRFARINAFEDALDLLALIPESWFMDSIQIQMDLDRPFAQAATELCEMLVDAGIVGINIKDIAEEFTQPGYGKA